MKLKDVLLVLITALPGFPQNVAFPQIEPDFSYITGPYLEVPVQLKLVVLESGEPHSVETDGSIPHNVVKALAAAKFEKSKAAHLFQLTVPVRVARDQFSVGSGSTRPWPQFMHEERVRKWSEKDARNVEAKLHDDEASVPDRLRLIAYAVGHPGAYAKEIRRRQIPWLVRNFPARKELATSAMFVNREGSPLADPELHAEVCGLWLAAIAAHPAQLDVLRSAAYFLSTSDPERVFGFLAPYRKKIGQIPVWMGEAYAMAALGVTERDPADGSVILAGAELPDTDFPVAARSRLKETEDLEIVLSAVHQVSSAAQSLSKAGHVPAGFGEFCDALMAHAKVLQPSIGHDCDTVPMNLEGHIIAANLIDKVAPQYPLAAKMRKIQGSVKFTAIIGKSGRIRDLEMNEGLFLLYEESRKAVSQWRYRPTLLNGKPVEVSTELDVNYAMRR